MSSANNFDGSSPQNFVVQQGLLVGAGATFGDDVSLAGNNLTGVSAISGGSATGLSISATAGPLKLLATSGGRSGTFVANNGTPVVVACAGLTANSVVLPTVKTAVGANAGAAIVVSATPGASFTIASGAADTSTYNYVVLDMA